MKKIFIKSEKGVSLIITFFIMIVLLAVVLSISTILYSGLRIMRNIGNSMVSFYAADSGIEKVLFYDRQKMLVSGSSCVSDEQCSANQTCNGDFCSTRGLCSIPTKCTPDSAMDSNGEHSIYCNSTCTSNSCAPAQLTPIIVGGCDPNTCTNCTVKFSTTFDGRIYDVSAGVSSNILPNEPPFYYLNVQSNGVFGGTARKIDIITNY